MRTKKCLLYDLISKKKIGTDFVWFNYLSKIVYNLIIYNGEYRKRHNS